MSGVVPALTNRSHIAVMTPKQEQITQCAERWKPYADRVEVVYGSPYGSMEEVETAAKAVAEMDVDLVVLDCIGYTAEMKARIQRIAGVPVILSRTLAARVVMEVLSGTQL